MLMTIVNEHVGFGNSAGLGSIISDFNSIIDLDGGISTLSGVTIELEYFGDFDVGFSTEYLSLNIEGHEFGPYSGPQYDGAFGPAAPTTVHFSISENEWAEIIRDGYINISYNLGSGNNNLSDAPGLEEYIKLTFSWEAPSPPIVANPIADQTIDEDTAWSFTVPSNAFSDVEVDALTFTATLGDDSALPSWLSFDAGTGTFSGTPPQEFHGVIDIKVTANDGAASAFDTFTLTITPVNDAPAGLPTAVLQPGVEDAPYVVDAADLLAGFSDAENDLLSVVGLSASGGGVVVDNGDGTYTVTMPADFNGTVTLSYQVSDGNGGTTAATQSFVMTPANDPAAVGGTLTGQVVEAGLAGPGTPAATGVASASDPDGGGSSFEPIKAGTASTRGYGSVEMARNGSWTYTLDNANATVNGLKHGETLRDTFTITTADGTTSTVTITIAGADDALIGTPDNDILHGGSGNDVFRPLEGDDDIFGGDGDDSVVLPGDADGYVFVQLANGRIGVLDIDPSDGDLGADVLDGIEFIRFGAETAADTPLAGLIDMEQPDWTLDRFETGLVAAVWQLFMQTVPSEAGFEYLIRSETNPHDLTDAYYSPYNAENKYLNFTTNLATGNPDGQAWFDLAFGALSYEAAVEKAFDLIITAAALTAAGGDPDASKQFFLDAESYFEQVAADRIVPSVGVSLDDAKKIALLSSVLYEAVRADIGPYADAVNDFADQVQRVGTSGDFLADLLQSA